MADGRGSRGPGGRALEAARYRNARDAAALPVPEDDCARAAGRTFDGGGDGQARGPPTFHESDEVREVANNAIDAAMARGDFDHLAYAGKPIPGLDGTDDPDWWIKGLLQREHVSGLGPPALMLRKEDAELDQTLDAEGSEASVRAILADFNARIAAARRQLAGGPPVTTRLRDIDAEAAAWRARAQSRSACSASAETPAPAPGAVPAAPPGRRRRIPRFFAHR